MALKITSKPNPPPSIPTAPPVPTPALPAPVPPQPPTLASNGAFTHKLGVLKIGNTHYIMEARNWPGEKLTDEEKKSLFDLFSAQFAQIEISDKELEIQFKPDCAELVAGPNKERILKLNHSVVITLTKMLTNRAQPIDLKTLNTPASLDPPPAFQWGDHNCAWISLLSAYFLIPEIQEALRTGPAELKPLYDLVTQDRANLENTPPEKLKEILVASLPPGNVLNLVTNNKYVAPDEIWECLRPLFLKDNFLPVSVLPTGQAPKKLQEVIAEETRNQSPDYLDIDLADPRVFPPLTVDAYSLVSMTLSNNQHVISLVRKQNSNGDLCLFLCDSGPNGRKVVKPLSNYEYHELLHTGQLPDASLQGYKPVQAVYKNTSPKTVAPSVSPPLAPLPAEPAKTWLGTAADVASMFLGSRG